jgi:hypothetical protein
MQLCYRFKPACVNDCHGGEHPFITAVMHSCRDVQTLMLDKLSGLDYCRIKKMMEKVDSTKVEPKIRTKLLEKVQSEQFK